MITYIEGNLFLSTAQTLVNTVNTVGVMGKGLAKDFKAFYPAMCEEYKRQCADGTLAIGSLLLYRTAHKWVLNVPTKRHWKQASRLGDIEQGLETFQRTYAEQGITSIAFPQLGCGHGGLDWESQVRPLMERYLGALPIDVFVYVPSRSFDASSVMREEIANWLAAPSSPMSYAAFRADLGSLAPYLRTDQESDGVFDLWRQMRSTGYLLPNDVDIALGIPAEHFFMQLTHLPYITRVRVARRADISYDEGSTDSLFRLPGAQGVQFLPPLAMGQALPQTPIDDESAMACRANQTQRQLALFSTT